MSKNLVIVESPAKARTIERYLGADYKVLASYGHVRDLPENPGKGKFGVDVDHDFAPEYVVSDDRRKQLADITKAVKIADDVSVAVRLVVEREREISAFTAREYWTLEALLATADGAVFAAELIRIDGEALNVGDEETANRHAAALRDLKPRVTKVATRKQSRSP